MHNCSEYLLGRFIARGSSSKCLAQKETSQKRVALYNYFGRGEKFLVTMEVYFRTDHPNYRVSLYLVNHFMSVWVYQNLKYLFLISGVDCQGQCSCCRGLYPSTLAYLMGAFINDVTKIYECFRRRKRPIFFQFTAKDNSVFFFRFHKICFSRKSQGGLTLF